MLSRTENSRPTTDLLQQPQLAHWQLLNELLQQVYPQQTGQLCLKWKLNVPDSAVHSSVAATVHSSPREGVLLRLIARLQVRLPATIQP